MGATSQIGTSGESVRFHLSGDRVYRALTRFLSRNAAYPSGARRQRCLRRTSLISPKHKSGMQLHDGLLSLTTRRFRRVRRGFLLRRLGRRADFWPHRKEHLTSAYFFR